MKSKAAILVELKKPLVIEEVEIPPLGYGQVLVEVGVSRICGSQLGEIDGVKGPDRWLPHLLGHEGGGTVLEVGPEVTHVKPGDRVVLHWRPGAGIQARPPVYRGEGGQVVNAGWITTFNQYAVVSENRLTKVPQDTDLEVCSLMADTITTGFGAITNDARVKIGESVVIIGVGGIGLGAVLGASIAGAHPVVAVDLHDHKLQQALRTGATHAFNARDATWDEQVKEALGGYADVVIDGTGSPEVMRKAWSLAGARGRMVGIGVMRFDQEFSLNTLPLHFGKILTGSEGGSSMPHIDIPRYLRMLADKRTHFDGFVSHRCKLEDINPAIATMRAGDSLHTMIHF
jgi:S-(hydroxymethyl)glutathione dehydrogenase/alcohol dehydrogenase